MRSKRYLSVDPCVSHERAVLYELRLFTYIFTQPLPELPKLLKHESLGGRDDVLIIFVSQE